MIKMINAGQAMNYEDVPLDIFKLIINNECICYGDVMGNKVNSIAVFTGSAVQPSDIILRFIGVKDELRFQGYANSLLNYCKDVFTKNNIRGIYIKLNENNYEISGHNEFLIANRFIPVCTSGHSLEYTVGMLKNSETIKKVLDNIESFPKTERIGDWAARGLRQFLIRNKENGLFLSKDSHNPKFSRIYRQDEFIKAAMFVGEYEKGYIVSKIYLEDDVKPSLIIPSLIAGLIDGLSDMNDNSIVKIHVYRPNVYNGLLTLLGEPVRETNMCEYYLPLRNRN